MNLKTYLCFSHKNKINAFSSISNFNSKFEFHLVFDKIFVKRFHMSLEKRIHYYCLARNATLANGVIIYSDFIASTVYKIELHKHSYD